MGQLLPTGLGSQATRYLAFPFARLRSDASAPGQPSRRLSPQWPADGDSGVSRQPTLYDELCRTGGTYGPVLGGVVKAWDRHRRAGRALGGKFGGVDWGVFRLPAAWGYRGTTGCGGVGGFRVAGCWRSFSAVG